MEYANPDSWGRGDFDSDADRKPDSGYQHKFAKLERSGRCGDRSNCNSGRDCSGIRDAHSPDIDDDLGLKFAIGHAGDFRERRTDVCGKWNV